MTLEWVKLGVADDMKLGVADDVKLGVADDPYLRLQTFRPTIIPIRPTNTNHDADDDDDTDNGENDLL